MTDALEANVAVAVLAPWQWNAPIAPLSVVAQLAEALARSVAVALEWVTPGSALGYVAQVTRPPGQAFHLAVIVTCVVGMLVLRGRDFTRLWEDINDKLVDVSP